MEISEIRRDNLRQLMMKRFSGKQARIAEALGKSPNYISRCLASPDAPGAKKIGEDLAREVEEMLGLPRYAMDIQSLNMDADGKLTANAVFIGPQEGWDEDGPLGENEVDVSSIVEVPDPDELTRTTVQISKACTKRYPKRVFADAGVDPTNGGYLCMIGNSMLPVLPEGSDVLLDLASRQVVDGKMYAIDLHGRLMVMVVYRHIGGGFRLRSYNRDEYPDQECSSEDIDSKRVRILGRVFWYAAQV